MNFGHITDENWKEFETTFPNAHRFLSQKSLLNELAQLERWESEKFVLTQWQINRLKELREWFKNLS